MVAAVPMGASERQHVHLPNPPGAIRRWLASHPRVIDNFILVCYLIGALPLGAIATLSVLQDSDSFAVGSAYGALVLVRIAAGVTALVLRRRAPLLGLIIVTLALIGEAGPLIAANGVALWFLLYAVPVYRDVKSGWIGYIIAVVGSGITVAMSPMLSSIGGFEAVVGVSGTESTVLDAIWLLVVLLIGINLGNRRRYLQAIIDRALQLARERDQLAQLAVAEERSRLAREIHDIVAHSVSVMIALSEGGARAVEAAPEEAANAMRRSAETGRTALAEMRRLLGALQSDEAAELAPQPSVDEIPSLLSGFEEAGLRVSFVNHATDGGDRLQGLAMYRVIQEGLTNVLRYAGPGALVDVTLQDYGDHTVVSVRDFGRAEGTSGPTTGLGSGRGLAGVAERVRVFGGTIESGPVSGEPGWRLSATFPRSTQVQSYEDEKHD